MTLYAGPDVGEKATHRCVVDAEGGVVWHGACATDPRDAAGSPDPARQASDKRKESTSD